MPKILADDSIIVESTEVIQTDEQPRPEKGERGDRGPKGKDGRDGIDGKDGKDGKDGRDGKDGESGRDGKNGRDGQQGPAGRDGKNGKDGEKGERGQPGKNGEAGDKWFIFKTQVDEKKGKEGDLCIVQSTSNYYQRISTDVGLIWKWQGNLRGEKGEQGERGPQGASGSGGGAGGGSSQNGGLSLVTVPISVSSGQTNTWLSVTNTLSEVAEVEAYDSTNQEKLELDIRILPPQNVQIRSKKINTYNIRIIGE